MAKEKDIVQEAVADVNALKASAFKNAKDVLTNIMSEDLKRVVANTLHEELATGDDQPTGYDEDGEQKRKGDQVDAVGHTGGDHLEDEGDGPAIVEAGLEDDDEMEDFDDEDFGDDDEEVELDLDMEMDDDEWEDEGEEEISFEMDDDEWVEDDDAGEDMEMDSDMDDMDDEIEIVDDEEDDIAEEASSLRNENKSLTASNKKLQKENARLSKAVGYLKDRIDEVNLFNARLAYASRLFRKVALTKEQKERVIERFDEAESIKEVKNTYSALTEGFRARPSTQKRVSVRKRNIKPSVKKEQLSEGKDYQRMNELAGLLD